MKKLLTLFFFLFSILTLCQTKDSIVLRLESSLKNASTNIQRTNALLSLGHYYLETDLIQSEKYLEKVKEYVNTSDVQNLALLNEKLADLNRKKGNYSNALQYGMEAENLFTKLKDTSGIVKSLISLGITSRFRNNNRQSINYYKRAVKLSNKKDRASLLGKSYNMLGIAYRRLNVLDSAMVSYWNAKHIFENLKDEYQVISVDNNLAVLYSKQGKYEKSLPIFLNNLMINKKGNRKMSIAIGYYNVAMDYFKMKKYNTSFRYVDSSFNISKKEGYKFRVLKTFELKSNINKEQRDFKSALKYNTAFHKLSDSIFNIENENKLREFELNRAFDLEKREIEIKASERKKKNQLYILFLILLLTLGSFTAYLLLKNYKGKNKYLATKVDKQILQQELLDEKVKVADNELKLLVADNSMRLSYLKLFADRLKEDHQKHELFEVKTYIKQLQFDLQQQLSTEKKLSAIQNKVNNVNRKFENSLIKLYPKLTKSEREVCALLRVNLSIKEVATIRNSTIESIKSIRYRLRKKLDIPKEVELENFIKAI